MGVGRGHAGDTQVQASLKSKGIESIRAHRSPLAVHLGSRGKAPETDRMVKFA